MKAEVECLEELSGHADAGELIDWMKPMTGPPRGPATLKQVFLVHGERDESVPLANPSSSRH